MISKTEEQEIEYRRRSANAKISLLNWTGQDHMQALELYISCNRLSWN